MSEDRYLASPVSSPPDDVEDSLVVGKRPEGDDEVEPGTPTGILLVDDHPEDLVALRAVLEPLGERLITADSGEEALRALIHEDVAVILLDMRMPKLDGLQTAQIVRSRPRTRHIPIICRRQGRGSPSPSIVVTYLSGMQPAR